MSLLQSAQNRRRLEAWPSCRGDVAMMFCLDDGAGRQADPGRCRSASVSATTAVALATLLATLPGCAAYGPGELKVGDAQQAVAATMGAATARHTLASGQTRLVYARGPQGKHTWMVDIGADGRIVSIRQVLVERELAAIGPGLAAEALLREFGPPAQRRAGGLAGGEVWSYRYFNYDCRWFQVSIGDDRRISSTSFGADPDCEPYNDS
jgi:hypothetical protein